MSNRQKVQDMFGLHVADTLAEEGLIAPDQADTDFHITATPGPVYEPTHWRVRVRVDRSATPPDSWPPNNMKRQLKDVCYAFRNISARYPNANRTQTSAELVFDNERMAKSQAKMCQKFGLIVEISPCVLVEVHLIDRMQG